jgi:hypothetical protein
MSRSSLTQCSQSAAITAARVFTGEVPKCYGMKRFPIRLFLERGPRRTRHCVGQPMAPAVRSKQSLHERGKHQDEGGASTRLYSGSHCQHRLSGRWPRALLLSHLDPGSVPRESLRSLHLGQTARQTSHRLLHSKRFLVYGSSFKLQLDQPNLMFHSLDSPNFSAFGFYTLWSWSRALHLCCKTENFARFEVCFDLPGRPPNRAQLFLRKEFELVSDVL